MHRPHHLAAAAHDRAPALPASVLARLQGGGWLESAWVGAVLAVVLAVVLALTVRAGLRRRGVLRVVAGAAASLLLATLTTAAFVNSYAGYVPDLSAAGRLLGYTATSGVVGLGASAGPTASGTVTRYVVGDPADRVPPSPLWVWTPPGYDAPGSTARYPVVYLLHGYVGNAADWFAAGRADSTLDLLVSQHVVPPVIVVAPDMNAGSLPRDTEGMNLPGGPQVETYLTRTVVRWADRNLRTVPDPAHRILGGLSAGGSVALDLGLRHQTLYGGILALEPYGDPGANTLPELGGSRALFDRYSPDRYIPTMHVARAVPMYIDVGSRARPDVTVRLARMLTARGFPVEFRVERGYAHTWHEARVGLPYGLLWLTSRLGWTTPVSTV